MDEKTRKDSTAQSSKGWVQVGLDREYRERYREAVTAYTRAIKLDPEFPSFYCMRGFAYNKLGFNRQALTDFNKAIKLNPQGVEGYNLRGALYAKSGELKKAVKDFSKSLSFDPNQPEALGRRGSVYLILNETAKGIEDFRRAAAMGHEGCRAYLKRLEAPTD